MSFQRKSTKKSSMFKIQAQKNVFLEYLEQVSNCKVLQSFPQLNEKIIKETSQTIYSYCYSFREDSPFTRGLNYDGRNIGFSTMDNLILYKEWLPNISQAYLFGQFNDFNKESHQLKPVVGETNWFQLQLDINNVQLSEGTPLTLRIIDNQGKEHLMIPPSCYTTVGNRGSYFRYKKCPMTKNHSKIQELLAYEINIQQIPLTKLSDYIRHQKDKLTNFNTIILKNLFNNNKGLFNRNKLDQNELSLLSDSIEIISQELAAKVVIDWNCQGGKLTYQSNPIENIFLKCSQQGVYNFNFLEGQVFSYYLSLMSFYLNYLNIGGFRLINVDKLTCNHQELVLIKCMKILNDRLAENGVTIATSAKLVPGLSYPLLEGGLGMQYCSNSFSCQIIDFHVQLCQKIKKNQNYENCSYINLENFKQNSYLSFLAITLFSSRGIIVKGELPKDCDLLNKILKLRTQSQFFEEESQIIQLSKQQLVFKRGKTQIYFNFSQIEKKKQLINLNDNYQLVYNFSNNQIIIKQGQFTIPQRCCIIFEFSQEND